MHFTGSFKVCHLWEFMLSLLLNPVHNRVVKWEDAERGIFRIIDSRRVAELWGQQKQNHNMNYEKLSRALRSVSAFPYCTVLHWWHLLLRPVIVFEVRC